MIRTNHLLLLAFFLLIFGKGYSQQSSDDFEFLVSKIKNDYPGYNEKAKPELHRLENQLRDKIKAYPDSAFYYFTEYISYFKDGHLRIERNIVDRPVPKKLEVSSYGKVFSVDKLSGKFGSSQLEDIWTSLIGDIAMIKCPDKKHTLLGVSINFGKWNPGNVVYEFTFINDTLFNIREHSMYEGKKPIDRKGSLELDRQILEIHDCNIYFTRKTESPKYNNAVLYTYLPKHPNGRNIYPKAVVLDDSTFYMRITSFNGTKDYINELVAKNWQNIMQRPNLIIDIRSNYGGQSDAYAVLEPLFYTNEFLTKGVEWYASAGNIEHFEQVLALKDVRNGEEGIKWIRSLVDEMKTNVGGYVVHPDDNREELVKMDTVYINPKKIGIIIEKTNVSAAEQFLLYAKNSTKVILFGNEPTAGILDYSNVTPNVFPSNKYELYCPMSRSLRLPDAPIDNKGVEPDVHIPFPPTQNLFDRYDDWIYFVMNYLNEPENNKNIE